ncbi:MAG: purine-cytosine permease family protein [Ferrimicrobium sp.]
MKNALEFPMAEAGPLGVEQRGIDYIPESERWARPRDLFWMWAGAIFNIEYVVYGALAMSFGLSFIQAVAIILVGNLSFFLLGLTSLQGPEAGTTTFIINRAPYGPNGSKLLSFFNWLTQVGFETEGLALIVLAAIALAQKGGIDASTGLKIVFIVGAGALQLVLPLFGHGVILKTLRILSIPFLILFVLMAGLTVTKINLHSVAHGASWQTMFAVLAIVISGSGLGWTENGNDFSRYLPRSASKSRTVGWVFLGTAIPSILLMTLGAAIFTFVPNATNPISGLPHAFSAWFLVPYLVVAIVQLFAINSLDLYSSGVTLQALGLRFTRLQAVVFDTIICTILTAYATFSNQFNTLLGDFVLFIIVWVAPWTAIYLIDWLLRKRRYDPTALHEARGGLYWGRGGVHWPAIVAQLLGMFASLMAINTTIFVGPISSATGGADFSVFTGFIVAGAVYWVIAHKRVSQLISSEL